MAGKLSRSAYDFESDDPLGWRKDAACGQHPNRDLWFASGGTYAVQMAQAAHICARHCPVLAACGKWAEAIGLQQLGSTVTGGVYYATKNGHTVTAGMQPADPGHGPWCATYRGL